MVQLQLITQRCAVLKGKLNFIANEAIKRILTENPQITVKMQVSSNNIHRFFDILPYITNRYCMGYLDPPGMVYKPNSLVDTGKLEEWYNEIMLIHLTNKATETQIMKAAEDLDGYIKFVVNVETGDVILGGLRHFEGEQFLLKRGSRQRSLWGGGYDLESKMIDYDSIINIRPNDGNPSKEVLSPEIRNTILTILIEKTGWKI